MLALSYLISTVSLRCKKIVFTRGQLLVDLWIPEGTFTGTEAPVLSVRIGPKNPASVAMRHA